MLRIGFPRPLVIAIALFISSFVVGAAPAYASHYRYATIYWERVLTHPNPAEIQVKVTIEIGARWSYPWNPMANPPVGTVLSDAQLTFDKAAKVNASATLVSSMTFTPTVNSINAASDTLYGSHTFTLTYPAASNPVTISLTNCCRVSNLLDGNNDQNMRIAMSIDTTLGTKSPRSVSLPIINVFANVPNDVVIPTVAFDNYTNRIRVATTTESGLPNPLPLAPSVFSVDPTVPGLLHFTPRDVGLYAMQLIITSYDGSGVAKSSVPLDFMFQATAASIAYTATVSSPSTTYTATIGAPMTATVNATLTPPDAFYSGAINNTALPAGMTFTVPAHNGVGTTTGTISYTPTATSTASVVCFQSTYTKSGFPIIYSPGQLCLTFNIGAAPTTLTGAFVGVQGGAPAAVGNPMTVQATLTRTADSAPVLGRQVSFFFIDDPATIIGTGTTNAAGVATLTFTPALSTPARTMQANFTAIANDLYLGSTGFISVPAVSGFSPLVTVQQPPNVLVGTAVPIAGQLIRQVAPAGPVSGATLSFTLTAPGGATTNVSGTTNASGLVNTTTTPTAKGVHSITAQYSGAGGSATSSAASFTVYQPALLSMPGTISGTAGSMTTVTATLTTVPQGTPIVGEAVTFSFGGAAAAQTGTTDANGVATVSTSFAAAGNFTASASFLNMAASYTDHTGSIPPAAETVSTFVSMASATTSLANLTAPSTELVGNGLTVSTVLTRTSAPAGPLNGASVQFSLAGASTATMTATTAANGTATATFPSLTARGAHTITVTYAGDAGFSPATPKTGQVTVYQRALLSMPGTISGTAGNPTLVTATLISVPGGTPIAGEAVTFSFGGAAAAQTVTTDASGVAAVNVTIPAAGSFTASASFLNAASLYTDHTGSIPPVAETASASVSMASVPTSLSNPIVPAAELVGNGLTVSTVLTRTLAPIGPLSGRSVQFTLAGASTATLTATTDSNGMASVTFPSLSVRGAHTVSATYAGTPGVNAAVSNSAPVTVYQRASLSMPGTISGTAGSATLVTASLTSVPLGTPIAGQTVTFSFGGAAAAQTGTTDASGVATVNVTIAAAGTFTASASFLNAASLYTNHTGSIPPTPETASASLSMASAATSLANLTVPSTEFVGNGLTVSTVLMRTSAPTGPLGGASVLFSLAGASTATLTATTDSNGMATVTFPSLSVRGAHTVSATYAGTPGVNAAISNSASVTVYQRVSLTVPTVNGLAGANIPLTAALMTVPGGTPLSGQTVSFSFGGVAPSSSTTTDSNGLATVSVNIATAGSYPADVSFANLGGLFADQNGNLIPSSASPVVNVSPAATSLSPISVASTQFVGTQLTVSTVLSRTVAPAGLLAGRSVVFTIAGASTVTVSAVTDVNGVAQVSIPLANKGAHTVSATFAGDAGLSGSSSGSTPFSVYQRAQLVFAAVPGSVAGGVSTVTATLVALPANTPIGSAPIAFDFDGPVLPQSVPTNGSGIATAQVSFPAAGFFSATAVFNDVAGFYANAAGLLASEVAVTSIEVNSAATSLAPLVASANNLVGNDLTVSTVLTRTSAPAGPIAGVPVAFTLSGGPTLVGITNASGAVNVTFTSLSAVGSPTVSAMFAGDGALEPATASTVVSVYQRTALALAPIAATPGSNVVIQATLAFIPGSQTPSGRTVTFSFGGALPAASVTTDASGVASITVQFPLPGAFPVTATFSDPAGFFTDAAGSIPPVATTAVTVAAIIKATTTLATLAVPAFTLVGDVVNASTTLMRSSAPVGPVAGATVTFTVTHSGGGTTTYTVVTDAAGSASAAIPSTITGAFTVVASFAGDISFDSAASAVASTSVFQRAALSLNTPSGSAGTSIAVVATLVDQPANLPLGGQAVTFTFVGAGAPGPMTATTNAAGVATVSPTFATPGTFAVQATFINAAGYFTNAAGALPPAAELATSSVQATNNAPTFTPPANISVPATSAAGATAFFTAMGSDLEDGPIAAVCSPSSPSNFLLGTTTVNCTVTDSVGASVSGSFTVTVTNNVPTFTPPANIFAEATSASGAAVVFTAEGADLEQGTLPAVCSPVSGTTLGLGTETVTCTVTDQTGAQVSGTFTVTVRDTTAPVIAAHGNEISEATSAAGAVVSFTAPSYTDAVGGNGVATCTPASGSMFAIGTTTVVCTANDGQGNTATSSFTVRVADTTAPVVTVDDVTVEATGALTMVPFGAAAMDLVNGVIVPTCTLSSPASLSVGSVTVTCTATDTAGNTGSDSATLRVTDTTPPALTLPSNITVHASSAAGATVTYATSSLDLAAGVRPVVCSSPSRGTFPLGTTTVTCTSSDLAGNTSRGLFTVTVTNVAPVCSTIPSVSEIWPPNHRMVPVGLTVTDADGDTVSINVTGIFQDEPTNTAGDGNTSSDATGVGTASPQVRAERAGTPKVPGNGRVYHVFYSATDQVGASCSAVAKVGVPHDQGNRSTLVDDGVRFNAVTGAKVP